MTRNVREGVIQVKLVILEVVYKEKFRALLGNVRARTETKNEQGGERE